MVLARAQVLITRFSFLLFIAETLVISESSTYGPFLILLAISDSQNWLLRRLAALATANDQALRRFLVLASFHAFLVAPRIDDVAATASTTAVRVVDRIHYFTAHLRPLAQPPTLAGLAVRHQLVLGVADSTDGRQAVAVDHAGFGRRHAQRDIIAFFCDYLERRTGGARQLSTLARLQLDVVN